MLMELTLSSLSTMTANGCFIVPRVVTALCDNGILQSLRLLRYLVL